MITSKEWALAGKIAGPIEYLWRIRLIRFAGGSCVNLGTKLCLTAIFERLGLPLWLNYGLVHAVVVVIAYLFHSKVTFRESHRSLAGFKRFFVSVLGLKILDYGIVVLTAHAEKIKDLAYTAPYIGLYLGDYILYFIIILTTVLIFALRYMVFKHIVFKAHTDTKRKNP